MRLRYERGALSDLEEIFAYIAADNPKAAARLVARIEAAARAITETPRMGEATRNPRFRRLVIGNYLLVYEIAPDEIVIHYLRHGARRRAWESPA